MECSPASQSVKLIGIEVGAVNGGVTTGAPATAQFEFVGVIFAANENLSGANERTLSLGVTLEAEIVVAFDEQLGVDRTVRAMTNSAAFAQGFVFKNEWLGLFAVTGGAGLVQSRHGEAAGRFQDVSPVRVVTLNAIHPAFDHGMMLRQVEFRMGFEMAIEARGCVFAGIKNELPASAANGDVFTAGAVTRFATARADFGIGRKVHSRM
jgi:hypothetical protein